MFELENLRPTHKNRLYMEYSSWRELPWSKKDPDKKYHEMNLEFDSEVESLGELGEVFLKFARNMGFENIESIIFNLGYDRDSKEQRFHEVDLYEEYNYTGKEQLGVSSDPWETVEYDEDDEIREELERERQFNEMNEGEDL